MGIDWDTMVFDYSRQVGGQPWSLVAQESEGLAIEVSRNFSAFNHKIAFAYTEAIYD